MNEPRDQTPDQPANALGPDASCKDAQKQAIRSRIRLRLAQLEIQNPDHFIRQGVIIADRLRALPEVIRARTFLAYSPLPREADITSLFPHLLGLALPRVSMRSASTGVPPINEMDAYQIFPAQWESDLQPGAFGIREPKAHLPRVDPSQIEVILLPGLAFDSRGGRIGKGRGFYDRYITSQWPTGKRPLLIGVCLDEQLIEDVPMSRHDIRVDRVVTDVRTIVCQTQ